MSQERVDNYVEGDSEEEEVRNFFMFLIFVKRKYFIDVQI